MDTTSKVFVSPRSTISVPDEVPSSVVQYVSSLPSRTFAGLNAVSLPLADVAPTTASAARLSAKVSLMFAPNSASLSRIS